MDFSLEPLVQIQKDLTPPDGREYWTVPQEDGQRPFFNTREVASVFFGKRKLWFQLLQNRHEIQIPKSEAGYRRFQLYHVELIAHTFLLQGIIDLRTFRNAIMIIRSIADNYRLD